MSEINKRLLSSIIIIPIVLVCIIQGSFLFNFFLFIIFLISLYEWRNMSVNKIYLFLGYIFLFFSFYTVLYLRNSDFENSLFIFLLIVLISVSTDIGGFLFGKIFKGPKLTKISPNKTYAGVLGAYILSLITSYLAIKYSSENILLKNIEYNFNQFFFIIIISTVSQLGDILVSFFKRLSNIKDTGKLLPGHGGILDRIDGMIFTFPFYHIFY